MSIENSNVETFSETVEVPRFRVTNNAESIDFDDDAQLTNIDKGNERLADEFKNEKRDTHPDTGNERITPTEKQYLLESFKQGKSRVEGIVNQSKLYLAAVIGTIVVVLYTAYAAITSNYSKKKRFTSLIKNDELDFFQ